MASRQINPLSCASHSGICMVFVARHERRGVPHLKVSGKGEKTRYVPLHGVAGDLIAEYLKKAGHGNDLSGALFRSLRNSRGGGREKAITPDGVYKLVRKYSVALGFEMGHTPCAPRPRPMPSIMKRILPRSKMARPFQHRHDADLRSPKD